MNNENEAIEKEEPPVEEIKDWATLSDEAKAEVSRMGIILERNRRL